MSLFTQLERLVAQSIKPGEHERFDDIADLCRQPADQFMIENGLISCWVAADHNGDVWAYSSEPELHHLGFWTSEKAQKAKRLFILADTILSPETFITEMAL